MNNLILVTIISFVTSVIVNTILLNKSIQTLDDCWIESFFELVRLKLEYLKTHK